MEAKAWQGGKRQAFLHLVSVLKAMMLGGHVSRVGVFFTILTGAVISLLNLPQLGERKLR